MRLTDLIQAISTPFVAHGSTEGILISAICNDSRKAIHGALFAAIPGLRCDGLLYAQAAHERGAVVLLTPRLVDIPYVVQIVAGDVRQALGEIASAFSGNPGSQMLMYGVTGTNGKTTTTHFLESILASAGLKTGLIGTIYVKYNGSRQSSNLTSPDSPQLQGILRNMVEHGVEATVLELSSHALALKRLSGCGFNGVGITNLTHDHLDFHRSFAAYREAKLSVTDLLHRAGYPRFVVANIEDSTYPDIVSRSCCPVISFGFDARAEVSPVRIETTEWGTRCCFSTPLGLMQTDVKLPGMHNVANAMAAVAFGCASGIDRDAIAWGVQALDAVPGRFQPVRGQFLRGLVDFAHNPDGLYSLLSAARQVTRGKLILVFGCQGRRDPLKRPIMGSIAAQMAEETILTTDDLYDEAPEEIAVPIVHGYHSVRSDGLTIHWRRDQAIAEAVARASSNDLVIVAGRGPETRLVFGEEISHFDDALYLEHCIKMRENRGN